MSANPNVITTEREDAARTAALRAWGIGVKSAEVIPIRKPLGLGIIPNDDDDDAYLGPEATTAKVIAKSIANLSEEQLAAPCSMRDLFELAIGGTVETSFRDGDLLREKLRELRREASDAQAGLRTEIAELRLALVEARCEISAMRAIQENARTLSRGEQGIAGPRGIPGPPGPQGLRGEKGDTASRPAGFILNVEEFSAVLALSDGSPGPRLALRPLFELFAAQIAADDD